MFSKYTVLISLLLCSLILQGHALTRRDLATTDNPNVAEIVEDQRLEVNLTRDQISFFKYIYRVEDTETQIYDLSIDVTPLDGLSDPDLYVTKNKPFTANQLIDADYYDTSVGYDIVVIPKENITANDTFYIAVTCVSEVCKFRLNVQKTGSIWLRSSEAVRLFYREDAEEIIRVFIPPSTPTNPITRIIISAALLNSYMIDKPIHMFADRDQRPPGSSSHDLSAVNAWFEGKAIIIYDTDEYFCTNCTYTVLIQAQENTLLKVSTQTYGHNIMMSLGETRHDAVKYDENVTYSVLIPNGGDIGNDSIIIQFVPYEGRASLRVNPNALPAASQSFYWESRFRDSQEIVITAEERKAAGLKDILYIVIEGIRSTTFELKVFSGSKGRNDLRLGMAAVGYALKGEIINYLLPVFTKEEEDIKIILTEVSGNSNAYLKSCRSKTNCTISQAEIDDYEQGKKNASDKGDIFLATDTLSGQETIQFTHSPKECAPDSLLDWFFGVADHCYYAVAVVNSGTTKRSKYHLNPFVAGSIVQLPESVATRGHVELDEDDYYVFTVTEEVDFVSLVIQVTPISGEVEIYASKTERYPNETIYDFRNYFFDTIIIRKEDTPDKRISGTYYINIHGVESSTYSIIAYFQVNPSAVNDTTGNGTNQLDTDNDRTIEMNEGVPQHLVLTKGGSVLLSFSVNFEYDLRREVDVILQPNGGRFNMYATNGNFTPSSSDYHFKSSNNKLVIAKDSKYFVNSGTYLVRVYDNSTTSNSLYSRFTITYVTSDHFITLKPREPFYDFLAANKTMYYRLEIEDEDESVKIVVSGGQGNLDLLVSVDAENPLPSPENYDIKPARDVEVLTLNKTMIDKACNSTSRNETGTEDHRCFVFLAVTTNETDGVYYTLTTYTKGDYLEIKEATPVSVPLEKVNNTVHLYFTPATANTSTEIVFTSEVFNVRVYASIVDRRTHPKIVNWNWPTTTRYSYSTGAVYNPLNIYKITIPPEEIKKYTQNGVVQCSVALTIVNTGFIGDDPSSPPDQSTNESDNYVPEEYTFTVVATSDVIPLEVGKPMLSYVAEEQYRYFQIRVTKPKCVLLITVTPLTDGDPDLFVSFGEDIRPASELGNVDFVSSSFKGEQLEISNEDILPRLSMEGIWTIGVYGYANCTFTITALYEDVKIVPLITGVPADFELRSGEIQYFRWYNYYADEFSVIIMEEEGHVIARVNTLSDEDDFLEKFPKNNGTWVSGTHTTERTIIKISEAKDKSNFCIDCSYLIGVYSKSPARGFITISIPGEAVYLQDGRPVRYTVDKGKYELFQYMNWEAAPRFDINMIIYSGHPEIYIGMDSDVSKEKYTWSLIPHADEKLVNLRLENLNHSANRAPPSDSDFETLVNPFSYYIAVYGREASSYLIMAALEDVEVLLSEGVMTYGFISPGEYQTYQFYCSVDFPATNQRLKLLINVYNDRFTKYENLTDDQIKHVPKTEIEYDNLKQGIDQQNFKVPILRNETTYRDFQGMVRNQQILQVKEQEGLYTIKLSNPYNHSINFSIIANRLDRFTIPLGTSLMSRVGVGEVEMFELYVNQSGRLVIKTVSCFGAVRFAIADSLEKLQNREFLTEVRRPSIDGITYGGVMVTPGMIYIGVQGIEGLVDSENDPTREALYKFEAVLLPNETLPPYEYFKAGNNGNIFVYEEPRDNFTRQVHFEWTGIELSSTAPLDSSYQYTVQYTLVVTRDPLFSQSYSLCSYLPLEFANFSGRDPYLYEFSESIKLKDLNGTQKKFTHTYPLAKDKLYTVAVTAVVKAYKDGIEKWEVPIVYMSDTIALVEYVEPNNNFLYGLVAVCAFGLIGILLGVCWFFFRYRYLKRELRYQIAATEVSNLEEPQIGTRKRKQPESTSIHD